MQDKHLEASGPERPWCASSHVFRLITPRRGISDLYEDPFDPSCIMARMSLSRKLLVIAQLVCAPFVSAADNIALLSAASAGEHAHLMSLAIEDGELHVVLHHDDESTGRAGDALDTTDHDVHLRDGVTAITAARQSDERPAAAVMGTVVMRLVSVDRITVATPHFETPPFPLLLSATSIRI